MRKRVKENEVYGKLRVIKILGAIKEKQKDFYCEVKCKCGNEEIIKGTFLKNSKKTMCRECYKKHNSSYKHGLTNTRLFNIWQSMSQRCNCKTCQAFKWYGARGIKICDEWKDFINFYNWAVNNGYKSNLTIDRINVNGNYEPSNCRWVTWEVQANNKRTNKFITYKGETHTYAEWDRIRGFRPSTVGNRIRAGWSIEKTLEVK